MYTAINTTEHGLVSQCLGFTKKASRLQYNVLEMSSMTIKALLPSPRYTCHDATKSVLRNIRSLLTNCILKAVNVRVGVSKNLELSNTPIKKSAAVRSGELEVRVRVHHLLAKTDAQRFVRSS